MNFSKKQSGLAFLEIMLVVALFILGVIIISSTFKDVQKRARDSKRISDITQIEKALNIYYASTSHFPKVSTEVIITGDDIFSLTLKDEFTGQKIPTDPLYPTFSYRYVSDEDGSAYQIKFCLETTSIQEYTQGCENSVGS